MKSKYIPNLKEVYDAGIDVRDSYIPEKWRKSFDNFIMGQACYAETKEDGTREFIYYSHDFRRWYHDNQVAIERDIKIDNVLK